MKTNQPDLLDDTVKTLGLLAEAVGGGLACYGAITLLEGYEQDDPDTKGYGLKLLLEGASMAAFGPAAVGSGLAQSGVGSDIG